MWEPVRAEAGAAGQAESSSGRLAGKQRGPASGSLGSLGHTTVLSIRPAVLVPHRSPGRPWGSRLALDPPEYGIHLFHEVSLRRLERCQNL